ncbi:MAG TPA: non-heme iron oxygenase ferredoxin subunit [Acidimicrobiia bacterium]|nr:non-heme iron oxygenase ferredoxin subunit [Acidimicrobiia bacterium]
MWLEVLREDEIEDGRGVRVDVAGERIAVFRDGERLYAIGDRCSHAEASLSEGYVFDGEVECPRHGAIFDLGTGEALALPATRPVPTYGLRTRDGVVEVEVSE